MRFGRAGNLFENNFPEGERKVGYGPVVCFEESDELRIGGTPHIRRVDNTGFRAPERVFL